MPRNYMGDDEIIKSYTELQDMGVEAAKKAYSDFDYDREYEWESTPFYNVPETTASAVRSSGKFVSMTEGAREKVRRRGIEQNGMNYTTALAITTNTMGMNVFYPHLVDDNPIEEGYVVNANDVIAEYQQEGLTVDVGALTEAINGGDIQSPQDLEDWKERHALFNTAQDTRSLHNGFVDFVAAAPFGLLDPINIPEMVVVALTGGVSVLPRIAIGGIGGALTNVASERIIQDKMSQSDTDAVMFAATLGLVVGGGVGGVFGRKPRVPDPHAPTSTHIDGAVYDVTDGTVYTPDPVPYVPLTPLEIEEAAALSLLKRSAGEVKELKGIKKGKEHDLEVAKKELDELDKALEEAPQTTVPKAPVGKRNAQKKAQAASKAQEGVARTKDVAARQAVVDSIALIEAELAGIKKVTIENNRARAAEASLSRDATERTKPSPRASSMFADKGRTPNKGAFGNRAATDSPTPNLGDTATPAGANTADYTSAFDDTQSAASMAEDSGLGERRAEEVFVDEANEAGVTDIFNADTYLDDIPTSNRYSVTLLTNLTKSSLNAVRWFGHSVDTLVSSASGYVHKGATLKEIRRKLSGAAGTLGKDVNAAQQALGYGVWSRGKEFKRFMQDIETQYRLHVNGKELTKPEFSDIISKRAVYDALKKDMLEKAGIDALDDHLLRAWDFDMLIGTPRGILVTDFTNAIISKRELKLGRVLDDIELLKAGEDAIIQIDRLTRITSRNSGTTSLGARHIIDLDESVVDKYLMSNIHSILASDRQNLTGRIATGQLFGFVDDVGKSKFLADIRKKGDKEIADRNLDETTRNKALTQLDKHLADMDLTIKHVWETAMTPNKPNGIANTIKTFMSDLSTGTLAPGFGAISAGSEIAEVFGSGSLTAVYRAAGLSLKEGLNQIQRLPADDKYYRFVTTIVDAHHGYSGSAVGRFVNDAGDVQQSHKGFILKATEAYRNLGIRVGGVADVADIYKVSSAMASIDDVLTLDVTTLSKRQLRQFNTAKYSLEDIVELQAFNRANPLERLDEAGTFKHYALWELPEDILLKFSNYVANRADHAIISGDKIHMPAPFSANDPLTVLLTQFLSFPAQAQESLLNKGFNQGGIRTGVGVTFSAGTISALLITQEELGVKLGYIKESKRRYNVFNGDEVAWANLAADVLSKIGSLASLSYLGGMYETTFGDHNSRSAIAAYGGYNAQKVEALFRAFIDKDTTAVRHVLKQNFAMGYSTVAGKAVLEALSELEKGY